MHFVFFIHFRYKERLKWKYIQPRQQSNILRATQWRFVRNDTDDFRTGIPGVSKENIVYKVSKFNNYQNSNYLMYMYLHLSVCLVSVRLV